MKLNGKFMQAAALAVLLPAAVMIAGCGENSAKASDKPNFVRHHNATGTVTYKSINGTFDDVVVYSKDIVGTKNDLTCVQVRGTSESGVSCNWDQANGLVPAAP